MTAQREVRLEDLLGKTVRNQYGRAIGCIEDLRVEPDGEDYLVTEFLIGPLERLRRLLAFMGQVPTFRALGLGRERQVRPMPWHWIDLSDPERPVLRVEGGKDGKDGKDGKEGKGGRI
jgi:sporulation protein YlmC with PRC-barrel domain